MTFRQTRVDLDARAFVKGLSSAVEDIVRRAEGHVERVGAGMARDAQARVPVDMGKLRASQSVSTGRTRLTRSSKTGRSRGGNFFFQVRYRDPAAWPQELGTSKHKAQPFMRPARARAAERLGRP